MTMISDLSWDLLEEILSRVPITSRRRVRSTCKGWNVISNDQSFIKKHCGKAAKERLMIMNYNYNACLMDVKDLVASPMKVLGNFRSQVKISQVIHCDGLLLCVTTDQPKRFVVYNPYLGQARWIEPISNVKRSYWYALGYDKNKNHKFLRFFDNDLNKYNILHISFVYEIYDFKTKSWKVVEDNPDHDIQLRYQDTSISLKGNAYFVAHDKLILLCFDFTKERFGQPLHLPFGCYVLHSLTLSSVREEQLAALFQRKVTYDIEIWITSKIDSDAVSWSSLFRVVMNLPKTRFFFYSETFFVVDEKEKVAVVYILDNISVSDYKAYVIGVDGCYKEIMLLGKSFGWAKGCPYVPSLVQI